MRPKEGIQGRSRKIGRDEILEGAKLGRLYIKIYKTQKRGGIKLSLRFRGKGDLRVRAGGYPRFHDQHVK